MYCTNMLLCPLTLFLWGSRSNVPGVLEGHYCGDKMVEVKLLVKLWLFSLRLNRRVRGRPCIFLLASLSLVSEELTSSPLFCSFPRL